MLVADPEENEPRPTYFKQLGRYITESATPEPDREEQLRRTLEGIRALKWHNAN